MASLEFAGLKGDNIRIKKNMYKNDSIERIFRLGGEDLLDAEDKGYVEDEDEVNDVLEDLNDSRFFQSIIIQLWDILGLVTL